MQNVPPRLVCVLVSLALAACNSASVSSSGASATAATAPAVTSNATTAASAPAPGSPARGPAATAPATATAPAAVVSSPISSLSPIYPPVQSSAAPGGPVTVLPASTMAIAAPGTVKYPAVAAIKLPQGFAVGADISWVQEDEGRGLKFKDNGVEKDIFEILKAHGFNYVRFRVFVEPKNAGGYATRMTEAYCDLPHTIAMAKRAKAAGMGLLIDFHYSDNWADPGKQVKPLLWQQLAFDDLVKAVHDYTQDAMAQFKAAGATPDMVQVGNEITPGLLLNRPGARGAQPVSDQPEGSTRDWTKLAALLKAGIAGVKDVDPKILIMLHIDRGGDNRATVRWVDSALAQGVQFDVLGLSCYTNYHGPPENWKANFDDLVVRYPNLSFMIAEYSQRKRDTNDIMRYLPAGKGLGTFIWEPTRYEERIFDPRGNALPNMVEYDQMKADYAKK